MASWDLQVDIHRTKIKSQVFVKSCPEAVQITCQIIAILAGSNAHRSVPFPSPSSTRNTALVDIWLTLEKARELPMQQWGLIYRFWNWWCHQKVQWHQKVNCWWERWGLEDLDLGGHSNGIHVRCRDGHVHNMNTRHRFYSRKGTKIFLSIMTSCQR